MNSDLQLIAGILVRWLYASSILFSIFYSIRIRNKFSLILSIGIAIGFVLNFVDGSLSTITWFIIYSVAYAMIIGYGFCKKGIKRILITGMTFLVFIRLLSSYEHWPIGSTASLLGIISFLAFLFIFFFKKNEFKNELGFLTMIAADGLLFFVYQFT